MTHFTQILAFWRAPAGAKYFFLILYILTDIRYKFYANRRTGAKVIGYQIYMENDANCDTNCDAFFWRFGVRQAAHYIFPL